jgi:hypothetical protein
MYRPADAATRGELIIGRVHDRVNIETGDIDDPSAERWTL